MRSEQLAHEARALFIIDGFRATSVYPVPLNAIHTVAYFTDALAAIWHKAALHDIVLKTRAAPRGARLQVAINRLVGRGMIVPSQIEYMYDAGLLRLQAKYSMQSALTSKFVDLITNDERWQRERAFTREIAIAIASVGRDRIGRTVMVDASYSDPLLDFETVVDLAPALGERSRTWSASALLAQIASNKLGHTLSPSELTSLYLRHLYPYTEAEA